MAAPPTRVHKSGPMYTTSSVGTSTRWRTTPRNCLSLLVFIAVRMRRLVPTSHNRCETTLPTYEYNLDEMNELITALERSIEEITTHCDNARSTVAAVLNHYSGSAATAFTEFHEGWQATAREHLESLKAYRTHVATARDNYAEARRKNIEMFR